MDVQSLPAGEIDRSGSGVSAGGAQPQAPAAAEPMAPAQQAAVSHLADLRKQASDPALDHGKRDALMRKMSELSRHAFLGEKAPTWYAPAADARDTSTEPFDGMAEMNRQLE